MELIYHPMELRTTVQRENQAIILSEVVRKMKEAYNKQFEKIYTLKETEVERIESKNERMSEILGELGSSKDIYAPQWDPSERPERLIVVAADEVPFEKYLSKEERARLKREDEERLGREANQTGDNME